MYILGTFLFFQNLLYLIISYCVKNFIWFPYVPFELFTFLCLAALFMCFQFIEVLCKNTTLVSNIFYFSISTILVNNSSFTSKYHSFQQHYTNDMCIQGCRALCAWGAWGSPASPKFLVRPPDNPFSL